MSTITTARTAQLPRVNLLPPEIAADRRFRVLQAGLGVAILVALLIIGGIYLLAAAAQGRAEDELAVSQAAQVKLDREVAQYAEVPAVFAQVAKAETQLKTAMGSEVRWSNYLSDLTSRVPADVALTRIEFMQKPSGNVTTVGGVDTGGAIIANIDYKGVALAPGANGSRANLATWLESLAKHKSYANPYFVLSEADPKKKTPIVEFSSSVDVNEQALSRRYLTPKGK